MYSLLLDSLQGQLGLDSSIGTENITFKASESISNVKYEDIYTDHISRQMYVKGTGDPLIRKNFASMKIQSQLQIGSEDASLDR